MTPSDVPVEGQEDFAPNVAADLVKASLANGGGIHGVVNGQVIGGGNPPRGRNQATAMGAEAGVSADGKTKSTVAGKWSLQDLLATALQKTDPANWKNSFQQPDSKATTSTMESSKNQKTADTFRPQQLGTGSFVSGFPAGKQIYHQAGNQATAQGRQFTENQTTSAGNQMRQGAGNQAINAAVARNQMEQAAARQGFQATGKTPPQSAGKTPSQSAGNTPSQSAGKAPPQSAGKAPSQSAGNTQSFGNQDVMRHGLIKVPVAPREADGKESIYRRVAKFLLLIGTDEAAKVISHLSPEQTERIIPEIVSIRRIDPDEAAVILEEFKALLDNARQQGGVATARNILEKAFGSDRAEELISKAVPFPEGVPFDYLQEMDGERVFFLLKDEPPPVQTLVLSRLKPAVAAEVINQLDSEQKKEIIRRLAKLAPMDPEILRRVDKAMHDKVLAMNTHAADSMDGRGALTEILKRMSPNAEKDILTALADLDPDLSNDIRDRLFTMDDILMADDRFIQKKLHTMGEGEIALLIAGKPESFRQKILSNVSKNRGDVILEEEVLRRPMRRRDCDEVTARFFSILRRAWEEGTLIIHGRSDDIYV